MAHVTYPALRLGKITVDGDENDEEKKIARLHIVSELIKKPSSSVERLILGMGCPIENMDVFEACTTVTRFVLIPYVKSNNFSSPALQQKLRSIETRNQQLACFCANPSAYPHNNQLLKLMHQFDPSPTGRYMLARRFPEIPAFFIKTNNESTDSAVVAESKKSTDAHSTQRVSLTCCVVQ